MVQFLDPEIAEMQGFRIIKLLKWTKIFLDPEIVEMVQYLDQETADIKFRRSYKSYKNLNGKLFCK